MPLGFPPDGLASALAYEATASDIFVASYPKSGTTWLQYIVFLLVRGRRLPADTRLDEVFPHLEELGSAALQAQPLPHLIKTHLRFESVPYNAAARYLIIARNPFDVVVSFFYHTQGFPQHYDFAEGSFADFFDCFLAGAVDFGDYFEHLLSWHRVRDRPNHLWLTYESLRRDPLPGIRRIAAFVGCEDAVTTTAGLAGIEQESRFESMQRQQQRWSSRRPDSATAFVRRGKVGDWRSLLTPGMTRALLAEFDRRLTGSGCENLWPDVLTEAREFAADAG